jgi:hypothetical protein
MGSLSNIEVLKLLALLNIPDQGSYYKNISALKEATLSLPAPVKNEGRSTPAPSSRLPPSSRDLRSSRAPSLAPTEDSGYFSGTRGSVASTPRRPTRSRSQTPAIRQQYASPPSQSPKSPSLEAHPITGSNAESFSPSAATTVSITNVGHIPTDAIGATEVKSWYYEYIPRAWEGDPQDLDSDENIVDVHKREFDSDDDMDGIKAARLWDRGHLRITEEQMNWCRSVFASLAKTQKLEKEREIDLKREERTYHSEALIDY